MSLDGIRSRNGPKHSISAIEARFRVILLKEFRIGRLSDKV